MTDLPTGTSESTGEAGETAELSPRDEGIKNAVVVPMSLIESSLGDEETIEAVRTALSLAATFAYDSGYNKAAEDFAGAIDGNYDPVPPSVQGLGEDGGWD